MNVVPLSSRYQPAGILRADTIMALLVIVFTELQIVRYLMKCKNGILAGHSLYKKVINTVPESVNKHSLGNIISIKLSNKSFRGIVLWILLLST